MKLNTYEMWLFIGQIIKHELHLNNRLIYKFGSYFKETTPDVCSKNQMAIYV
jgi:hypothetical protein